MGRKVQTDPLSRIKSADGSIAPERALEAVNSMMRLSMLQMNRIQEPFIRVKNKFGRMPRRRILETGEKTGKTRIGIAEDIAHAFGYRPWLRVDDPDYKINIRVPNHGVLGCMTMGQSVEMKVEPELKVLIPDICSPEYKNDTTGALKSVTFRYDLNGRVCGSQLHIRSYNQQSDTFLGIDPDYYHWDEPPPEKILIAAERGKVVTNAPSWFTMTPLSEAYIYDKFSVKAFNAGGEDPEIAIFHGSMWDNCQDYCFQCSVYIPVNDPVNMADPHGPRPCNVCPNCNQVMGFVPRAGIEEYDKLFTDPDERAAHIDGKWAHLSGLVYKELDREKHTYRDFKIPADWMRVEIVDPHDARPTCWLFAAVSPEEIVVNGKTSNRVYFYDYLLANGNVESIVRQVRVKRAEHDYSDPAYVILDAKYGTRSLKTLEEETSWEDELYRAGVLNIRLSHSNPGDIALGHKRVKEYLAPHYSSLKGREFPGMMWAENGTKGDKGPWQHMSNYQWKPGTDKPEEAYKDFCDCVRYCALDQPVYQSPKRADALAAMLAERQKPANPLLHGLRTV